MAARRVNAQDIAQAGSLSKLIAQLVDHVRAGNMETKEYGVSLLRSLSDQPQTQEKFPAVEKRKSSGGKTDLEVPGYVGDHCVMIANAYGIKPLVSLLLIGSPIAQRDACGALANIARKKPEYQEKVIQAGGVIAISALLRSGDAALQEQAAAALASVSYSPPSHKMIVAAGAIPSLVALLKVNMRSDAQTNAAAALANVATSNPEGQAAIAKAGAIPKLLDLLSGGKAYETGSRALARLAHANLANQQDICKLGGIPRLLPPLSGVNVEAQVEAALALAALASGERCKRRQEAIAKAGGIRPLLALVHSRYSQAQCAALTALAELCTNNRTNQDAIAALDGMQPLVTLISAGGGSVDVQICAARNLAQLVRHNQPIQHAVADLGAISLLVSLMRQTNSSEVEAEVAGALHSLGEGNPTNQGGIVSAGAIGVLVGLLGSRSDHSARLAANALSSLGLDNQESQTEISKLLVGMLTSAKREATQERAAAALWRLVRANPGDQLGIAMAGGAQPLVRLLREGPEGGKAFALWSLSLCINDSNREIIVEEGAIPPLVSLLTSEDAGICEQAAGALAQLSRSEPRNPKMLAQIAKNGAIAPLIALLDQTGRGSARQHAAAALSELALLPSLRNVIDRSGGISPLVKVLTDPFADGMSKKFAAAAVGLLSTEADDSSAQEQQQQQQQQQQQNGQQKQVPSEPTSPVPTSPVSSQPGTSTPPRSPVPPVIPPRDLPDSPDSEYANATRRSIPRKTLIAEEGAIAPLVALLRKGEQEQEEAAGALKALADAPNIRLAITESGAIGPLVVMLGGANPKARDNAEGALVRLSLEIANRVLIIQQLVSMLQDPSIAAREQAAAAIANLARESTANCTSIVDAGGIPPLLQLLLSDSSKAKENSASALSQLARGSRPTQDAICKAGGIPLLVGVLTASSSNKNDTSQGSLETIVLHAIWNMAKENLANQMALVEAGVIAPLVNMLGNASPELQLPATGAIECLLQSRDIQAAVVRTGAIAPLCMLSRDAMTETQEQAAAALWSLATDNAPNKTTIAKLGGIESLVKMVVTGGSDESQKNAGGALASLASKHAENRASIAKRIVGLLSGRGLYDKVEPQVAARALAAITRLCSRTVPKPVQGRDAQSESDMAMDILANQLAIAKANGVNSIIPWLSSEDEEAQKEAAHAMLSMSINNIQTQTIVARTEGLHGLIGVISGRCLEAQQHAALALWHLAYDTENQLAIAEAGGIPALVSMLGAVQTNDTERAAEIAAVTLVRLAGGNPTISIAIAEAGGIHPLVILLKCSAAQQSAAALAELALVARNRDAIANAGGIGPLITLLSSTTVGTPETAARALTHLARSEGIGESGDDNHNAASEDTSQAPTKGAMRGAEVRRAQIKKMGGVHKLIAMLDGSNLKTSSLRGAGSKSLWGEMRKVAEEQAVSSSHLPPAVDVGIKIGMAEQAAAALAELSFGDIDMQNAIIDAGGIPKILSLVLSGSSVAQQHSAATLWHLSTSIDNQVELASCGCIPELVSLVRNGSPNAQEAACGALANLAQGESQQSGESSDAESGPHGSTTFIAESPDPSAEKVEEAAPQTTTHDTASAPLQAGVSSMTGVSAKGDRPFAARVRIELRVLLGNGSPSRAHAEIDINVESPSTLAFLPARGTARGTEHVTSGTTIAQANGIAPIVALLGAKGATPKAKELAASALWHLASKPTTRDLIAHAGGIAPLVGLLDGGTHQAHRYASDALARLANESREHQSKIAKRLVSLLMGQNTSTVQRRAAHALQMLAADNPGSSVVIVKAGAISPLVHLLSTSADAEVKKEAGAALQSLVATRDDNEAAVADLVVLLGTGSSNTAQELVLHLLLTLASKESNRVSILQSNTLQKLVLQLDSASSKVQELAAAAISLLVRGSADHIAIVAAQGGIERLVAMLSSPSFDAQANAAAALADLTNGHEACHADVISAGALPLLVDMLNPTSRANAKAQAATTLASLANGDPRSQEIIVRAGALELLVGVLAEEDKAAQQNSASAISHLVTGNRTNQDLVATADGIRPLVRLLAEANSPECQDRAASALAQLAAEHHENKTSIAAAGGIELLVEVLQASSLVEAHKSTAEALKHLAADHIANQSAIAAAGGILPLVTHLGSGSTEVQEQTSEALANLAVGNDERGYTIASMLVKLLGDGETTSRGARAISRLAQRGGPNTQTCIAQAGAIQLLASILLESTANGAAGADDSMHSASSASLAGQEEVSKLSLQTDLILALHSLAAQHVDNQIAIAQAKVIPVLLQVLEPSAKVRKRSVILGGDVRSPGTPARRGSASLRKSIGDSPESRARGGSTLLRQSKGEQESTSPMMMTGKRTPALMKQVSRMSFGVSAIAEGSLHAGDALDSDEIASLMAIAAAALNSLAEAGANQQQIESLGGIKILVKTLCLENVPAQEAASGALHRMAATPQLRLAMHKAGAVVQLVDLLVHGSEKCKQEASRCLSKFCVDSLAHQESIADMLQRIMADSDANELEHATQVASDLSLQGQGSEVLNTAGLVPHLVNQVVEGVDNASDNAARTLGRIASMSAESRSSITNLLIAARHNTQDPRAIPRVGRALKEMNVEETEESQQAVGMAILMFRLHSRD